MDDAGVRPPPELRFGTSGLRGLVREMTDREVYVNVRGWLGYLAEVGELRAGEPVAVGEDLRETDPSTGLSSSPRIGRAVAKAVRDAGLRPLHCGRLPTPALAYFAAREPMPCVMVTGSHIPADRNGVKFYRKAGEILKSEEGAILAAVRRARAEVPPLFDPGGAFREAPPPEPVSGDALRAYAARYLEPYAGLRPLSGLRVVLFEHSAVGRDLLADVLRGLGAEVIGADRSEAFVPVDTEDVSAEDEARFAAYARRFAPDAIVSTDGDGDRPLVVDERGRFRRGDVVGLATAEFLGASFAAVPVSTSDAVDRRAAQERSGDGTPLEVRKTRIGSPYVLAAMLEAKARGLAGVVGWEANGGFLTASEFGLGAGVLRELPTRDALLPILAVLLSARAKRVSVSELFDSFPPRATRSGLLDGFATERSRRIVDALSPADPTLMEVEYRQGEVLAVSAGGEPLRLEAGAEGAASLLKARELLSRYFTRDRGFAPVCRVNYLDGVRIFFADGDIAHLRPSGNAPQLRIYAVSDTEERADRIVRLALEEPDGVLRQMEREIGE
ncbi:MAG: phosphomannomutase [Deltaproteobacteria bacterium]|nr:phosphomannomutase [Deltaproteobacteria bacterium]